MEWKVGRETILLFPGQEKQLGFVEYFLQCVFHLASGLPVTKVTGTK